MWRIRIDKTKRLAQVNALFSIWVTGYAKLFELMNGRRWGTKDTDPPLLHRRVKMCTTNQQRDICRLLKYSIEMSTWMSRWSTFHCIYMYLIMNGIVTNRRWANDLLCAEGRCVRANNTLFCYTGDFTFNIERQI